MQNNLSSIVKYSLSFLMVLVLSACGGGGNSGSSGSSSDDNSSAGEFIAKEVALEKIMAYSNGESVTAPTLNDYIAAGVSGVTSETLSELNAIVKGLSPEDVDTAEEIKALTTQLGVNTLPNANSGGNQTVQVNKSIAITGSGSDIDGTIVSYTWNKDGVVLATTASFTYTPTTIGTHLLTLIVTDDDGGTASSTMSLVVTDIPNGVNLPPKANAGENKETQVAVAIQITGSGSDSDGTIEAYEWTQGGNVLATTPVFDYTPTKEGTDTLTLTVIDNEGASSNDTMDVFVTAATPGNDTTPPIITLLGASSVNVDQGTTYINAGANAFDNIDGDITSNIVIGGDIINTNATPGTTFTVTYNVTDAAGNKATEVTRTVTIVSSVDTTKPVITLNGASTIELIQGVSYVEAGATVIDNRDGNITANLIIAGDTVNSNATPGTSFTITYNVSDAAGNVAIEVTRVVTISLSEDTTNPVITLNGPSTIEVIQGASYVEAGATATDNRDGNITANLTIAGDSVNTSASPGTTFVITYNVSDAAGNSAIEVTRSVSIIADPGNQIPVLSEANKQTYLASINNARAVARTCGVYGSFSAVPAVAWSDKLYKAAYEHSQDMTESNTFSHDGSGTVSDWSGYPLNKRSSMTDRVATYGFSWSRLSENISAGTSRDTAQEAIDSWLVSDGHCKNIMDANVTQVGMAISSKQGTSYTNYWTQNFGRSF